MVQTRSKNSRLNVGITNERFTRCWVPVTKTFNHIRNDPVVDWIILNTPKPSPDTRTTRPSVILQKGLDFEEAVIDYIHSNICKVVKVCDRFDSSKVKETKRLMDSNTPIIHSAPLEHKGLKCYGIADLIVHRNTLPYLIPSVDLEDDPSTYFVIDIKFSTLNQATSSESLRNSMKDLCYKSQVWCYTKCLEELGYNPSKAFILGRKTNKTTGAFDALGTVEFNREGPAIEERTVKAIQWIQDVTYWGKIWEGPEDRVELYPNMKNHMTCENVTKAKQDLADRIGEITSVWYCSYRNRMNAHSKGITSWKDPRCNATTLGIRDSLVVPINTILKTNQHPEQKISDFTLDKTELPGTTKCFIDFETTSDVLSKISLHNPSSLARIFCAGIHVLEEDGLSYFKQFVSKGLKDSDESILLKDVSKFLSTLNDPVLYHWYADEMIWNKSCLRLNLYSGNNAWVDLYELFVRNCIIVKGSLTFKLKHIVSALHKNGLIDLSYDGLETIKNGMDAQNVAKLYYDEKTEKKLQSSTSGVEKEFEEVLTYNEIDCKVLFEIYQKILSPRVY
jgi:hypothetical protein